MALDYGEGSTAQIYRHFGEESDEIFRKLSCVFISHMHADHHLVSFKARYAVFMPCDHLDNSVLWL